MPEPFIPVTQQAAAFRSDLLTGEFPRAIAAIEAGQEETLMVGLVALYEEELGERPKAAHATMALLEQNMEHAPAVVCRLMAALYPLASDMYLHEVCDAIDIWLHSEHPSELVEAFRRKADRSTGWMRRKYLEWAESIEKAQPSDRSLDGEPPSPERG